MFKLNENRKIRSTVELLTMNKNASVTFINIRHCLDSCRIRGLRYILKLHSFVVFAKCYLIYCVYIHRYYALAKSLILFAPFTMVSEMVITNHFMGELFQRYWRMV